MVLLDAIYNALGQFVTAVAVMMGAVHERFVQVRAERLVKRKAHGVEINERALFLLCDFANGVRIAFQRRALNACFAFHGGDQHGRTALGACFGNDLFRVGFVLVQRVWLFALHIIVAELHEEIIAGFHEAENFLKATARQGIGDGFTGFSVIGDGDFWLKENREHLAPTIPGLGRLVANRGITEDKNRRHIGLFNRQITKAGVRVVKFEG